MTGRDLLLDMLSYRRPAGSQTERQFIERFIAPTGAKPDGYGNYILRVGEWPVLWSAHTDTVHKQGGRQQVRVCGQTAMVPDGSNCLGADDGTGCWILLEMIRAGVEGLYVFHRAEETGCNGSRYIATHTPELLDGIQAAIAFDRRGYDSIVTHQVGFRTASDGFALSLSEALGISSLQPDDGGIFTDTLEYAHLIPECTNVSVGYTGAHGQWESQDLAFAEELRDAVIRMDLTALAILRSPFDPLGPRGGGWWDEDPEVPELGTDLGPDPEEWWWDDEDGFHYGEPELYRCDYCDAVSGDTYELSGGRVCGRCVEELV